jgi:hypothetical protein
VTRFRALGLSAAFLFTGFLAAGGLLAILQGPLGLPAGDLLTATALQSACSLVAFGLVTWLIGFRGASLDAITLRWRPARPRDMARGFALGAIPAAATMVLALPLARAAWRGDGHGVVEWAGSVGWLLVYLAPAALAEELIFRGVPLVLLAAAFGRGAAVVGLAVVFAIAHGLNPEVSPLALGNVALAGVMLGAVFFLPGGIWTATGAHIGWNATLAALAAPVSGVPLPVEGIDYLPGGPPWLTGGGFGPEGGLLATGVLALVTVVAVRLGREETSA